VTVLYCGQDHEHEALIAVEPSCGCVAALTVLTHEEPEAYKFAARESKVGLRIDRLPVEVVRAMPWVCDEHAATKGPPWWKSKGGKGKRPTSPGLGL